MEKGAERGCRWNGNHPLFQLLEDDVTCSVNIGYVAAMGDARQSRIVLVEASYMSEVFVVNGVMCRVPDLSVIWARGHKIVFKVDKDVEPLIVSPATWFMATTGQPAPEQDPSPIIDERTGPTELWADLDLLGGRCVVPVRVVETVKSPKACLLVQVRWALPFVENGSGSTGLSRRDAEYDTQGDRGQKRGALHGNWPLPQRSDRDPRSCYR